jgi:hypothetical protein
MVPLPPSAAKPDALRSLSTNRLLLSERTTIVCKIVNGSAVARRTGVMDVREYHGPPALAVVRGRELREEGTG